MKKEQFEENVMKIMKYISRMKLSYRDAIICLSICIDALSKAGEENGK